MYQAEGRRRADLESVTTTAVDKSAALRSLHAAMNVSISFESVNGMEQATRERVLQLLERTNQFNAWKRPTPPSILDTCDGVAMSVSDRYGNYGLVGVALYRRKTNCLRVVAFAMSCRKPGRCGARSAKVPPGGWQKTSCNARRWPSARYRANEMLVRRFLEADQTSKRSGPRHHRLQRRLVDELEQWLAAAPTLWHTYSAEELSALTFDPGEEAELPMPTKRLTTTVRRIGHRSRRWLSTRDPTHVPPNAPLSPLLISWSSWATLQSSMTRDGATPSL